MNLHSADKGEEQINGLGQAKAFFLEPYRVLDLTDEKGYLCGKILAGLGADVVKIEPPGGDKGRINGPNISALSGSTRSLYWSAFNFNKRSITLNLDTPDGKHIFKRLVKRADFVIESFTPGYLEELGLGYEVLHQLNPGMVMCSITPYGQTGPYRDFKGSDIVCWAGSGYMWLCGEPDRPPLRLAIPQAFLHGGAEAAMGAMIAFWYRQLTGQGQHVDVSIRESIMWECLNANATWDMNQVVLKREGNYRVFGPFRMRFLFPCKDGHVVVLLVGGTMGAKGQRALAEWVDHEGMSNEFLRNFDWDSFDASRYDDETARSLESTLEAFFMTKTKEELFNRALQMGFLLAPAETVRGLVENPHLKARDIWVEVDYPELKTSLIYPGAPFKSSECNWKLSRRAPFVGEDNKDIYERELGLSKNEIASLVGVGAI